MLGRGGEGLGKRSGVLEGLFDTPSVRWGWTRPGPVVLGCLARGFPAAPRAPRSIGTPRD